MKKIAILLFTTFISIALFANPKIYKGPDATGSSVTVPYLGEYTAANLQPDENELEYYSPPLTYYVFGFANSPNILAGSNGEVQNKSVYVPKCWMVAARILPKDNYYPPLGTGDIVYNALNGFPVFHNILHEGSYNLEEMGWNDQIVGYGGYKITGCTDLAMSTPRYEPLMCNGTVRRGVFSWLHINGASYTLQHRIGSSWSTPYSGSNSYFVDTRQGGSYSLRIRASANGSTGPWHNFTARVPACTPGGGGEIPR